MHTRMAQHCWTALHSHSHTKQWFSFLHPDWTTCLNITLRKTTFLEHTPGIEDDWEHLTRLALGDCFCCLIKAFSFFPNTSQVLCLWYETWKKGHWKEPRSPHGLAAVATDTHTRNRYKSTGKHHISHLWLWVCWICVQNTCQEFYTCELCELKKISLLTSGETQHSVKHISLLRDIFIYVSENNGVWRSGNTFGRTHSKCCIGNLYRHVQIGNYLSRYEQCCSVKSLIYRRRHH